MARLVLSYVLRRPRELLKLAFILLVTACAAHSFQALTLAFLTEGGR